MKIKKIYLETTMFNYYFDKDRDAHIDTLKLFEEIYEGKFEAYTSDYVLEELENASEPKRSKMLKLLEDYNIVILTFNEEAERLADIYVAEGIIPEKFRYDGIHIAVSTVNELDFIASLNFQHINKLKTKTMTEIINKREGYNGIYICSPMEVVDYE